MAGPSSSWAAAKYSGDNQHTVSSPNGRLSAITVSRSGSDRALFVLSDATVPQPHGDPPHSGLLASLWRLELPYAISHAVILPTWSADSAWVALTYASRAMTGGQGQGLDLLVVSTRSLQHKLYSLETHLQGQGAWKGDLAWAPSRDGRPLLAFLSPGSDGQVGSTPGRIVGAAACLRCCVQAACLQLEDQLGSHVGQPALQEVRHCAAGMADPRGLLQVLVTPRHVHMRKLGVELLSLRWPGTPGRTQWAPDASVLAGVPEAWRVCQQCSAVMHGQPKSQPHVATLLHQPLLQLCCSCMSPGCSGHHCIRADKQLLPLVPFPCLTRCCCAATQDGGEPSLVLHSIRHAHYATVQLPLVSLAGSNWAWSPASDMVLCAGEHAALFVSPDGARVRRQRLTTLPFGTTSVIWGCAGHVAVSGLGAGEPGLPHAACPTGCSCCAIWPQTSWSSACALSPAACCCSGPRTSAAHWPAWPCVVQLSPVPARSA